MKANLLTSVLLILGLLIPGIEFPGGHSGYGRFARWPDGVCSTSRRRSAKGHNRGADTRARLCLRQAAECCEGPGSDKESNWLPAPPGDFVLMLRLYWPDESDPSIIDGT
jgi:Protein of unknown function (DUF1214)